MKRKASKEGDAGPKTARPEAEIGNTDWEAKTVVQLRALLKRRGLPTSGQKAQLISRLRDNKSDSDSGTITNKRLKTKAKEDEEAEEEDEEDEMAEIDYIVKERTVPRSKRKEYLVRWVDGAEDGWLPESDLRGTPALKEWKDAIPPEDEAPALPPHRLDALVVQLAKLVEASRRMVVYTGAGISTSAGIPDFRGKNGLWVRGAPKRAVVELTTIEPTPTHRVLAELERMGKVHFIVSQNYDNLHIKSGFPKEKLAELHGNLFAEICAKCGMKYYRDYEVTKKDSDEDEDESEDDEDSHLTRRSCDQEGCDGALRDTIVHFGEGFEEDVFAAAVAKSKEADLTLCLGSKLSVTPACDMPFYCKQKRTKEQKKRDQRRAGRARTKDAGKKEEKAEENDEEGREGEAKVAICNLQPTDKDHEADLVIHHTCDEVMTALLDILNQRRTAAARAEEPVHD
ncbi:SAP domain containing protein [Acanthamoeba castellanii str. Neff]|uniref:protein acetyllysine N-acetyltransferase n=1 Tax=Acanthamoeba castellanii (strain ATCC 30010 / Neff) TaxID=1257118 RepID=L8HKV1_ACACF|nr:SAP domain containing protein [Acanthamoeba castellanii str. Neff]ELR25303.1 SAP domain containing protein [Acanthamoeba castellanii str. Neff]